MKYLLTHRVTRFVTIAGLGLIPLLALAQTTELPNPLGSADPLELFARFASALYLFATIAAFVWVVAGGYFILGAAGNSERYERGKKMIGMALLGMFITIGSYAILATSINVLTGNASVSLEGGDLVDPLNLNGAGAWAGAEIYGGRLLKYMLQGLGAATLIMFLLAGFTWFTAFGNEERATKAKKILQYAVIGLIVVLSAYMIVAFAVVPVLNVLQN